MMQIKNARMSKTKPAGRSRAKRPLRLTPAFSLAADGSVKLTHPLTRLFKRTTSLFLIAALALTAPLPTLAVTKTEKEKQEAQKKLEDANSKAQEAADKKKSAESQVNKLGDELTNLIYVMNILESDIASKGTEIEQAESDFQDAKASEESQYQSMKKRIKYIYESGDTDYLDVLMQSKSMSDLLNKTEYVQELYSYDRKMLTAFQETKERVLVLKHGLEEEHAEMEVMEEEYKEQKASLETMIAKKRTEVSDFDSQLAQAKKDAAAYAKSVEEKTAQVRKEQELARKKAEEERRKAEQAAQQAAQQASAKSANTGKTSDPLKKNNSSKGSSSGTTVKSSGGTATGRAIADYGLQFVGNPYVYGGTSLTNGADCSGFTKSVYSNFGVSLPRTSSEQASAGQAVSYSDMQPGDLVHYAGHIAIYIGNGQIVHASSAKTGIKVSDVGYRTILDIRRVL